MKLETIVYIIRCRYEKQVNASKSDVLTALVRMYGFTYELAKAALEELENVDQKSMEEEIKEYRMTFSIGSKVQIADRIVDQTAAEFAKACEIVGIDKETYLREKMDEIGEEFHMYGSLRQKENSLIQISEKLQTALSDLVEYMSEFFFRLGEESISFRYRALQSRLSEAEESPRNLWGKSAQELDCILEEYLEDEI